MYTLVLMTAVAAGPDATRFDGWGGCYGSACYGTSCSGCYGSCYGSCYGGPLFPRARAFFAGVGDGLRGAFAPPGSYRSWGCCGGYASCSGCYGSSCFGGSCYGGGVYTGSAVYGGCYGTSCVGCYGGGCGGLALPSIPAVSLAAGTGEVVALRPPAEPSVAALTVSLPATARLYVDGQLVAGDGASRRFHTPPLEAGRTFYYELKAELLVGGRVEAEELKVVVRAGDSKDVSFGKLAAR
jgi:uncharacterized protein (TIGR03000 family)